MHAFYNYNIMSSSLSVVYYSFGCNYNPIHLQFTTDLQDVVCSLDVATKFSRAIGLAKGVNICQANKAMSCIMLAQMINCLIYVCSEAKCIGQCRHGGELQERNSVSGSKKEDRIWDNGNLTTS